MCVTILLDMIKGFLSPGIAKRCDVNNGECMHFCETMGTFGAKCSCAAGYRLLDDGINCEPESIYISLYETSAECHDSDS